MAVCQNSRNRARFTLREIPSSPHFRFIILVEQSNDVNDDLQDSAVENLQSER